MLTRKAYVVTTNMRRMTVHATEPANVPKGTQLLLGEHITYFTDGHASFDRDGKLKVWK